MYRSIRLRHISLPAFIAAALLAAMAPACHAELVIQQATSTYNHLTNVSADTAFWDDDTYDSRKETYHRAETFSRFDPGLGTLESVTITFQRAGSLRYILGGSFWNAYTGAGSSKASADFSVTLDGPAFPTARTETQSRNGSLSGTFRGLNDEKHVDWGFTRLDTFTFTGADLAGFLGSGTFDVKNSLELFVDATETVNGLGAKLRVDHPAFPITGTTTVTYSYTAAVPEPSTLLVSCVAAVTCLVGYRRRRGDEAAHT